MYKNILPTLLLLLLSNLNSLYSQSIECNPYNHRVKNYIVEEENNYSISYVSCFHAQGVVVDLSYKDVMIGSHMMGKGHHHTVYGFISYRHRVGKRTLLHVGPLYRINNNSSLLIGQFGIDYKVYGPLHFTSRILQIRQDLNYLNVGMKLSL